MVKMLYQRHNIHTDFFEGPLDLLLHLIKKKKIEIKDVKISEITGDYTKYIFSNENIDPSREGEFLSMASTLIYIKSRSLIPKQRNDEISLEDDLIQTLIEYDKIQKISIILKNMEKAESLMWKRVGNEDKFSSKEFVIEDITTFQLAEIFMNLVNKLNREEVFTIESKKYSIEEKLKAILLLLKENDYLDFSNYLEGMPTIEEKLVNFFTLLEMIKQKIVTAIQKELFSKISVWKSFSGETEK